MKTAVVIPNWRGRELLEKNLPQVLKAGFDEVVVIDDRSPDDSVDFLRKNYPQITLVQNEKNLGFAKTVNRGVAATTADIIFLFNLDVVPQKNVITPVLRDFKDERVFGVSLAEQKFSWVKPKVVDGFILHEPGELTKTAHMTFWVSGGSGAFRRSMWEELGGMDEIFSPFYWEDVDLSYRGQKRGWKLLWEPKAKVIHEHEATINTKHFSQRYLNLIKERNQLIFHWKNLNLKWLFTSHLLGIFKRILRQPGYIIVVFLAKLKLPSVIVRRIKESGKNTLTDEQVIAEFK